MKKKDYIEKVLNNVAGIQRKTLKAELDDHICENSRFFKEIGYDTETAEEKAVEAMGDAEPVCEQFESIHNRKTKSDTFKDIGFGILMCIASLFLVSIIGNDYTEAVIFIFYTIIKACCVLLILYALSYKALNKNSNVLTIFSSVLLICWVIYSGKTLLFSAEYIEAHKELIRIITDILILAVFNLPIIINNIFAIIYRKKVNALSNTGKDIKKKNKLLKFSNTVIAVLAVSAVISLLAYIGISANIAKQIQNELSASIQTTLDLAEKIQADSGNTEEVLNNEKIEYKKDFDKYDDYSVTYYEYISNDKYISSGITCWDYYDNYEYHEDEDENESLNIYTSQKNDDSYIGLWSGFFSLHYIKTPVEYKEDVLSVNKSKYMNQSKEEIINTFVSYNPSSLSISYSESGMSYSFSYAVYYETYYTSLEFDNDGNLISAGTEVEAW